MKVKILIGNPALARTYTRQEFLQGNTNHSFIYASELSITAVYSLYAAVMFKILSLKYAFRSRTFRYRIIRTTGIFDLLLSFEKKRLDWKSLFMLPLKVAALLVLAPFALLPHSILSMINRVMPVAKENRNLISSCDILIFPFTAFEVEQLFLPKLCKDAGIKLVYIADNWDNLSSKTVILDPPDKIFVWGNQSVCHARLIQGLDEDIISIGSSPRLQVYNCMDNSSDSLKVIGFMGSFMYFDEISVINKICVMLPDDWKLLYRPHPWAMRQQSSNQSLHEKASFDVSDVGAFDDSISATRNFFQKVDLTVGGLTTMMLESLVAGRPCIALTIDDSPLNFYSPKMAYKNYTHFEGIENISDLLLIDNLLDFPAAFEYLKSKNRRKGTDKTLSYYVQVELPATLTNILGE